MIQSISMSHYNYNHYDMLQKLSPTNKENGSGDESKQAVLPRQKTLEILQRMEAIETKLETMAMQSSINSQSNPYNPHHQRNQVRG